MRDKLVSHTPVAFLPDIGCADCVALFERTQPAIYSIAVGSPAFHISAVRSNLIPRKAAGFLWAAGDGELLAGIDTAHQFGIGAWSYANRELVVVS